MGWETNSVGWRWESGCSLNAWLCVGMLTSLARLETRIFSVSQEMVFLTFENREWLQVTPIRPHLFLLIAYQHAQHSYFNNDCCGSADAATNERKLARLWERGCCSQPSWAEMKGYRPVICKLDWRNTRSSRPTFNGNQRVRTIRPWTVGL